MQPDTSIYPILKVTNNPNPNRLYAVPLLGMLIKFIILIPIYIELFFLSLALFVVVIINSFVVLFTGKYWQTAYDLGLGMMRFYTKLGFFVWGLTDKYPGFDLTINDSFSVDMPYPQTPSRGFAIPFLGGLARGLLMIPFYIFYSIISYAANIGTAVFGWFFVLFMGRYPETLFELQRDCNRLLLSIMAYSYGFTDKYPSFKISMDHQGYKIALIIVAIILQLLNFGGSFMQEEEVETDLPIPQFQNEFPATEAIPEFSQ